MDSKWIPFNKPYMTGKELDYIAEAHCNAMLAGDGPFTKRCHRWLENSTGVRKALLTHSCTAALEMAALLLDIKPGDEVIMPSYTFVSTANAFVLRGAIPVFVDIRADTLNLDENLIEAAITCRTKAIVVVHYAGVACEMDRILAIAGQYKLSVVEDAAQGILASYKGRALGAIGNLGAFSFHETKNIISGEGGALLVNDPGMMERAEIIREKGTDRSRFLRGEADKYSWIDLGSSYLPGEISAAFLYAQMEEAEFIIRRRLKIWYKYHDCFKQFEEAGRVRRPFIPDECTHNAHIYYLLMQDLNDRNQFIAQARKVGVDCIFHYIPLHDSSAGRRLGKISGDLMITEDLSERVVRLPLWLGLEKEQEYVIEAISDFLSTTQ